MMNLNIEEMSRQAANVQICNKLRQFFEDEKHKDLRFCQALFVLGLIKQDKDGKIIDNFNEESYDSIRKLYFNEITNK